MDKMNKELALGKLPQFRNICLLSLAAFLLCFLCYYFYGGYLTVLITSALLLGIFYYAQDVLLYHPDLPANSRIYIPIPTMHNLPHETVSIHTPDGIILHAFWIMQRDERAKCSPTFVYFHGNAGNMGHRMQNVWGIYYHLKCNILMVEYRGYGLSTGAPSEHGLVVDARAAIDYLFTRHDLDHRQIVLFGRSLGGAVVIDLAADKLYCGKLMCAIVENTFTSIADMAVELIHPWIKFLPLILYKNKFHSIRKISKCFLPFLFISGSADNLVPPKMMNDLYNQCSSERKRLLRISGGSHNDTWIADGYYDGIKNFLNECQCLAPPLEEPPKKSNIWHEIKNV